MIPHDDELAARFRLADPAVTAPDGELDERALADLGAMLGSVPRQPLAGVRAIRVQPSEALRA